MFFYMIYYASLINSMMFCCMKHPLAMGLMLMSQTILVCLITGSLMKTFWFSYILFLIFLGGMLVLFIYMTSLASNEMFSFSSKMLTMMILIMGSFLIMTFFSDKMIVSLYNLSWDASTMMKSESLMNENSIMLNKLCNFPVNLMTILLMIYLFLTLIAIVKITNIFEGPLRPSFK